ncbi:MAG: hypothetical protein V1720_22715 [bacterium]
MKHLTDVEIENYFLNMLSTEKAIKAGIHINECEECFYRAEEYHNAFAALDADLDRLADLPKIIEKHERAKQKHLQHTDKDSIKSIIEKLLNKSGDMLNSKLDEILAKLNDPAYQLTPFSYLLKELQEPLQPNKPPTVVKPKKEIISTLLPGKDFKIQKVDKNKIEFRIHTRANDLPTIFAHSPRKGIDVVNFAKVEGTNFYTALIPEKVVDKHYMVHRVKSSKRSNLLN